ncbi:MAG: ornithine--oxo-acid transaminase [Gammaproteobacteria bacterium]|nr:ornithine--oxo-acid transaminase [Gammaproteobacteria bacterium]
MPSSLQDQFIKKEALFGAQNYAPLSVVLEKGEGAYLWDVDGNKYLDMVSAYSAVSHGHSHPELVKIIKEQAGKLAITSRAFYTEPFGDFLEKLTSVSGFENVLTMNTGAEAVETAIKAARRWGYKTKGIQENAAEIIVADGNFHGRTTTIVGFSSEDSYKDGFGPFAKGFVEAKFCWTECGLNESIKSFEEKINKNTCAVLVEPIQGEAGIRVPQNGWLKKLREICSKNNVLLILDEIQSGLGRTGKLFAYEHEDIKPDGLILGKALGGAMLPISAFLSSKEVMNHFNAGSHGSTFGGNPLATKVASRAIELLFEDNLIENSNILGEYFKSKLKAIDNKIIKDVRGKGLWIGMELEESDINAKHLCLMLLNEGLLCKETHKTVIRFAPPLMITKKELDWAVDKISKVIRSV